MSFSTIRSPARARCSPALSNFWFGKLGHLVPNHMTGIDPESVVSGEAERAQVRGRAMVVKKFKPLSIEAIVRGYIIGSGWKDYQKTGAICGIALPAGLKEAEKLPQTLFTPSTKAPMGQHDENISFAEAEQRVGREAATQVRDAAISLYTHAAEYAATRGIIIADTKFEFGTDAAGRVYLIDEILTPDSSRFWPDGGIQSRHEPALVRQAVRARLAGDAALEQEGAGAAPARRHHRQDRREIPRSAAAACRGVK